MFQRGKSSVGRLALESGVGLLMGDKERRHEFKLQHCTLKQPFVYRAKQYCASYLVEKRW